jgi:PIN domain nuclease of toxin-antitoxin system
MGLRLDTHVVLWWLADNPTLEAAIKERLDLEQDVYASPATIWEVAIRQSIGKLDKPADLAERSRTAVPAPEHLVSLPNVWRTLRRTLPGTHRFPDLGKFS